MKVLTTTLLLVLLFASCEKLKKESHPEFEGDYDWVWSDSDTGVYDISESPDRYGFRIRKNGKVLFFKNGKLTDKGAITKVEDTYLSGKSVSITVGEKTYVFGTHTDEWYLSDFPFEGSTNYFRK